MYHTLIIVGNVGKDPEMRYTPSGQAVTSFSVATNKQYTNGQGETVKETIWFRVSAWGKQAEAWAMLWTAPWRRDMPLGAWPMAFWMVEKPRCASLS